MHHSADEDVGEFSGLSGHHCHQVIVNEFWVFVVLDFLNYVFLGSGVVLGVGGGGGLGHARERRGGGGSAEAVALVRQILAMGRDCDSVGGCGAPRPDAPMITFGTGSSYNQFVIQKTDTVALF